MTALGDRFHVSLDCGVENKHIGEVNIIVLAVALFPVLIPQSSFHSLHFTAIVACNAASCSNHVLYSRSCDGCVCYSTRLLKCLSIPRVHTLSLSKNMFMIIYIQTVVIMHEIFVSEYVHAVYVLVV